MISTNNYICFVIIKTQQPGDCNLGPTHRCRILEVKREGRVLVQPLAERECRALEVKHEGRV